MTTNPDAFPADWLRIRFASIHRVEITSLQGRVLGAGDIADPTNPDDIKSATIEALGRAMQR